MSLELVVPPRTRLLDWESRWAALLAHAEREPFAWGAMDCCTFASCNVAALTGVPPMKNGAWKTEAEAFWEVTHQGGMPFILRHLFGVPLSTPQWAQRGDLALIARPDEPNWAGLVVVEAGGWCAPGPRGLHRGDLSQCAIAWPVGRET